MGRACIISVGDELLAGRVEDTNATWLSRRLLSSGFAVVRRLTIGDDIDAISRTVASAMESADVVIVGGGLGPTEDDLTRFGVARALGVETSMDEEALDHVAGWFERAGRVLTEANRVQGVIPEGALAIPNPKGSAPGFRVQRRGCTLYVLPGVPSELKAMFEESLAPEFALNPSRGPAPLSRRLTIVGMPEAEMGSLLKDLMARGRDPEIGSYPGHGVIGLQISTSVADAQLARKLLDDDETEIRKRLGKTCLAGQGRSLVEVVAQHLLDRKLSFACAESLTGGLVSDLMIGVPGISSVFLAGIVAYGNEQKSALLGVPPSTFASEGAVSERCAREMAEGARRACGAAIAVSTTGIAGPGGAVPGKPVGTVFAAVATAEGTVVERRQFPGAREDVRERSAVFALDLVRRRLEGHV